VLFFGLVSIREFQYRFKNSIAYYQILTIDVPRTDYNVKDSKKPAVDDKAIKLNEEALERAIARENKKKEKQ